MSVLTTTLRSLLEHADGLFAVDRIAAARAAYEDLLERSQERTDRGMEVVARAMLARCLLRRHDVDGARDELAQAELRLDEGNREANARWRSARARIAIAEGPPEAASEQLQDYLAWARDAGAWPEAVDAALLIADGCTGDFRADWLQRAIDFAHEHEIEGVLGKAYADLAGALEGLDRIEEALGAYEHALEWHRRRGTTRQIVSACWAVGAIACRTEDWPLAQERLEQAAKLAETSDDCVDLLALALADLARVHEEAGDVIEARRVILRALGLGREQDLPRLWPERWDAMRAHARRLELDA